MMPMPWLELGDCHSTSTHLPRAACFFFFLRGSSTEIVFLISCRSTFLLILDHWVVLISVWAEEVRPVYLSPFKPQESLSEKWGAGALILRDKQHIGSLSCMKYLSQMFRAQSFFRKVAMPTQITGTSDRLGPDCILYEG